VLAYTTGSSKFVPLTDVLGSTIGLVSSLGSIATSWKYEPFGMPTVSSQGTNYPYLFAGMEYDSGPGLYHTYARYYHPRLQRFISEDPLQFGGGDINLFAYVGNDPVNEVDPLGLQVGEPLMAAQRFSDQRMNLAQTAIFGLFTTSFLTLVVLGYMWVGRIAAPV
jgi:RHS repeat-associated protein